MMTVCETQGLGVSSVPVQGPPAGLPTRLLNKPCWSQLRHWTHPCLHHKAGPYIGLQWMATKLQDASALACKAAACAQQSSLCNGEQSSSCSRACMRANGMRSVGLVAHTPGAGSVAVWRCVQSCWATFSLARNQLVASAVRTLACSHCAGDARGGDAEQRHIEQLGEGALYRQLPQSSVSVASQ